MKRLVLDTNIFVSSLLRKNTTPYILYKAWRDGVYELLTSQPQLDELKRVLNYPKLAKYIKPDEAQEIMSGLLVYSACIAPLPTVTYSPDPDDNLILATAIAGHADYLVSGDKRDLLALDTVEGVSIITARQALEFLGLDDVS